MKRNLTFVIFTLLFFITSTSYVQAQCTISASGSDVSGLVKSHWGQSFVPTCSNTLQSITFNAATNFTGAATLTVNNGSTCDAPVLHTQSLTSITNGNNAIVLSSPINVIAGNTYYFSVRTNNNTGWRIRFNSTSQIAGNLRTNNSSATTCSQSFANFDWNCSMNIGSSTSTVSITEFPENLQFYGRNLQNNKAIIPIKGGGTVGSIVRVVILRNGQTYSQQQVQLTNSTFSLNPQIDAELAQYTVQLFSVNNSGQASLIRQATQVVAGDVYIITGQSNSESAVFSGSASENRSDFIRVFGLGIDNATTLTNNLEWFIGQPDGGRNVLGNTGQWGSHFAKQLVDNEKIPICIFNGARGGWDISRFIKDENNPENLNTNYGRLLHRLNITKLAGKVRGLFWYQGETDAQFGLTTNEYKTQFNRLVDAWSADYPSIEHTYITQIRDGCSASQNQNVLIQEAHRQLGVELATTTTMSTKGLTHDGCHYPYVNGYKELGRRYFQLISRDLYGKNVTAAASPDIENAYFSQNNEITIQTKDGGNVTWQNGAQTYFRLEGSNASIVSGRTEGDKVVLQLSADGSGATGITYLDERRVTSPYVINQEGHGLLSFHNFPITAATTNCGNIALGKTAIQSSTLGNNNNRYGAANAIDGNTNGVHTSGSMTHTNNQQNAWWQIDLGTIHDLSTIKIWNRTDCCANRLTDFHVLVSDVAFNSNALATTINQSSVGDFHFTGTAGRETNINLNRSGRYVRIQLSGTNALQLAEVEIMGCEQSITSLYQHCNYTGSNISLNAGEYPNIANEGFPTNQLSSIRIPAGVQVILYQNTNFGGSSVTLTADNICLVNSSFNDRCSSLRIVNLNNNRAELYANCDYSGANISLGVGEYPNIINAGFANDALSSLRVPAGFQVTLYQHYNFGGSSITLNADDNCLGNNGFNNAMSSLKVEQVTNSIVSASNRTAPQLTFAAYQANRAVDLQWVSNSGYRVNTYEVEHSADGENFSSIGEYPNEKWTNDLAYHQTTDTQPKKGMNYYRVKENYSNGSFTYTPVQSVAFGIDLVDISVFPNPARAELFINLGLADRQRVDLIMTNHLGQEVKAVTIESAEAQLIQLNTADLLNGLYYLKIAVKGQKPFTKKVLINRLY